TCHGGSCTPGTAVVCGAPDQCHEARTCNPATGACSNPAKPNGTACSDDDACTVGDACQAGTCVPGAPVACTALDQCHNAATCNPAPGACSNPTKPNGTTCGAGDAGTRADTCEAGTCTAGNPVICTAQDQCHDAGTCDSSTGVCSNPAKPNGTTCDDGD